MPQLLKVLLVKSQCKALLTWTFLDVFESFSIHSRLGGIFLRTLELWHQKLGSLVKGPFNTWSICQWLGEICNLSADPCWP